MTDYRCPARSYIKSDGFPNNPTLHRVVSLSRSAVFGETTQEDSLIIPRIGTPPDRSATILDLKPNRPLHRQTRSACCPLAVQGCSGTAATRQLASFPTRHSRPSCSPSTTSESRDLPQLCSYPGRNPRVSPCTAYERSGGVSPPTIQMLSLWKQEPEGEPYGELSSLNVMY